VHIAAEFEQADLIQKREEIEFNTVRLSNIEKELREAKANQLYDEIRLLNFLRLTLLAELSADKRSAIKGFNLIGFEQAVAEFNHIALELRFRVVSL